MRRTTVVLLLAGWVIGHLEGASAAVPYPALVRNSPFGAIVAPQPAESSVQACQLRAVLEEEGRLYFSIFNPRTRRSTWMSLNDRLDGLHVTAYDARTHTVTVECEGRTLAVPLHGGASRGMAFSTGALVAPSTSADQPQLSASDEKAVALELERYKKLAAMAAAAREREIRAQANTRGN